jgi:thymidylate synthase
MLMEDDLGIIYGNNWRDFHDPEANEGFHHVGRREDQFQNLVNELKTNPFSRRMVVYAGNPLANHYCALPACHDRWQVKVANGKLNLLWSQRSVDVVLGLPSNITFYATLLHLLALEGGFEEGELIGHLGDCHIYNNAGSAAIQYMLRDSFDLPTISTKGFTNIFDWTHDQTKVSNYEAHERIKVEVAV